jgi:uncharacterized Fe-S cluster-containing radical SAM superfamily protein
MSVFSFGCVLQCVFCLYYIQAFFFRTANAHHANASDPLRLRKRKAGCGDLIHVNDEVESRRSVSPRRQPGSRSPWLG